LIPAYNIGGVLPPFLGPEPGRDFAEASPYECTSEELVDRFLTSDHRGRLLFGLMNFRAALRAAGVIHALQWIDGSFTEDVESRGLVPGDVDIVTFLYRPQAVLDDANWGQFVAAHETGFLNRAANKATYACDTMFVDMNALPHLIVEQAAYWNGLFSHQRRTFQWKGMLTIELGANDDGALAKLAAGGTQ
jgi:hypothetical protein